MKRENILEILENYKKKYPQEKEKINFLTDFVRSSEKPTDRKTLPGHITASALVVKGNGVLLIYHNKLKRFLQPGGHIENGDRDILSATLREVREEVGLDLRNSINKNLEPVFIDIHTIPENLKKDEREHQHYDFIFIFKIEEIEEVKLQAEEVSDFQWVDLDYDFKDDALMEAAKRARM